MLWQEPLVQALSGQVGWTKPSQLLLPAILGFAAAALFTALIRLSNLWLNGRLAAAVGSDLSCEAYQRTLYQPYGVHLERTSSSIITGITTHSRRTVSALNAFLQLTTSTVVASALLLGLMVVDAKVALCVAVLFGTAYGALAKTSRNKLRMNGKKISEALNQQIKALQEGLGAIRDVLLESNQHIYLGIYTRADRPQRRLQAESAFLGSFPRYALEALGMVAIAFLGGLLVLQQGSGTGVIPLLGTLALGAQRMLPALQQIYSGWASLKTNSNSIQALLDMLNQPLPPHLQIVQPLDLREDIRLEGVYFRYGPNQPDVLRGLNLQVRRGERIGFIGSTGSGKSTTVDILMGLLEPTKGSILIDGVR